MRRRDAMLALARPDADTEERDPQFVAALARGLDVLRAFRRGDPPLGNQELARRTGLPKPTVSRFTYTLSRLGYLTYRPELAKYELSVGALALGFTALGALGIRAVARPHMQAVANATGAPVALGTRERMTMVYVERCLGESPFTILLDVGSHIKLATTAMGRAYIAGLPQAERALLMEGLQAREGERWPGVKAGIEQACEDLAQRGFVISAGDWKGEVNAVGVPVRTGDGALGFALNCGGPTFLMPRERLIDEIGPRLAAAADAIRTAMDSPSSAAR